MDEAAKIDLIPKTVLDSWQASIPPTTSAAASIRPKSPRPPAPSHSTVARRRVCTSTGTPQTDVDFAIEDLIGSGGMGMVYQAAQISLGRKVALKTLPDSDTEIVSRQEHLREEALITGQLDHPNIVPVYDLATDERGRLFYTMKRVRGTAWSHLLPRQNLDERMGIFQRVCDAIAFAHSRGVIHRDLKPANVMLGAFGEVTVMDWGVACTVRGVDDPDALGDRFALCGTPAYLPPEMAQGDGWTVGVASDIYLLGAVLYELLEDRPPHGESDALACVKQAAENRIVPPQRDDELTRVAMRAMSAQPADRFASVLELQAAVRECVAHLESIRLARSAEDASREGETTDAYPAHARAIFGFEQSLARWPENAAARAGMSRARMAYARCARAKGDYELALSQLDAGDSSHTSERAEVEIELAAHRLRRHRLRLFVRATAGLAATLAIGAAVFGFIVRGKNVALNRQQAEILQQKGEIAQRLEEVRRSDRASLITLLRAQHAAGEYEAAVETALRLRETYDFDWSADPALRQLAREAAWMDPWRATMTPGVKNPRRLILTADETELYALGETDIVRIDPASMDVRERISLPSPSPNAELVQASADGALWCARGMDIFRREGTNWVQVATVPLPPDGRTFPPAITGLLVSRGNRRLAAGVNGEWLACRDADVSDTWRITRIEDQNSSKKSGPLAAGATCIIRDSPEGQWLAWRPALNHANAFVVEANPLRVRGWFYNRDSPIYDVAIRTDPLQLVAATYHGSIFRPDIEGAILLPQTYEAHVWRPECHGEWQTPLMDCETAAWRSDGRDVVTANARGWIWVSSSDPSIGRRMLLRTRTVSPISLAMDAGGQVYVLTAGGEIRKYDARLFSRRVLAANEPNPDQAPEDRPNPTDQGGPTPMKAPEGVQTHAMTMDPLGEYTAYATYTDVWIVNRAHMVQRVHFPFLTHAPIDMQFTPDGGGLVARQLWSPRFVLLQRGTWNTLNPSSTDLFSVGLHMAPFAGRMKVFVGGRASVACLDAATGATDWTSVCGTGPVRNLIPVPDGVYPKGPSLWAGSYMGTFVRISMQDGRALQRDEYWNQKLSKINIKMSYDPSVPFTALMLPGRDGLVVFWNGDLRPITPDLLPGGDCTGLSLSPGGSILYAHQQGNSIQFPMPRSSDLTRMSALLKRLFGPDAVDARLTATEDTP